MSSCGLMRCSSKQKHWILLKYEAASAGATLYVVRPTTVFAVRLYTLKKHSVGSPNRDSIHDCSGMNKIGTSDAPKSALNITLTTCDTWLSSSFWDSNAFAWCSAICFAVAPPCFVAVEQYKRYSG